MARNAKLALIDRKEELTREIKYYDMRIKEARKRLAEKNNNCYGESSSSDSEIEFEINSRPSDRDMKVSTFMLQTCIQATQELTTLEVLDSMVNIMVDDPVIEGEPPITEDGIWKEVLTECRVDLIPFSMTFYSHHSKRLFGPIQYRGLQVKLVRPAHEEELSKSVLPDVTTPSDAVEVLRSYAEAHRSRRSTLARLVKKYGDLLFMEPMTGGGYTLKCANVLEISWTLLNRWSHIAPFHHKMKFDLEYMDETYIKIITQIHKQLSDPSVDTDERTLLLDKIIETCLKARNDAGEDSEAGSNKQTDESGNTHNIKDSDIMAPPKTLPKKVKPKKRSNDNPASASKKPRIDDKENQMFASSNNKQKTGGAGSSVPNKQIASSKNDNSEHTDTTNNKNKKDVDNEKNKVINDKHQIKTAKNKDNVKQNATGNTKHQSAKKDNINLKQKENNEANSKEINKNSEGTKNNGKSNAGNKKKVATNSKDENVAIAEDKITKESDKGKMIKTVKDNNDNVASAKHKTTKADTVDGKANKIDKDNNEKKVVDKVNSKNNKDNVAIVENKITKANSVKADDKSNKADKDSNVNNIDKIKGKNTKNKIINNKAVADRNPRIVDTDKSKFKNNNDNVAISKNNNDNGKTSKTVKDTEKVASTNFKNNYNDDNVAISKNKITNKDNDVNITKKKLKKVSSSNSKNGNTANVAISKNKMTKAHKEDKDNLTDNNSKNNNNVDILKNNKIVRLEQNKISKKLKSKLLNIEKEVPFKKSKIVNVLDRPNVSKLYTQTLKDRFANKNSVASSKDVDRSSKIPQRIIALDARRNVLRLSPRLSHKPTFSTRMNGN